MKKIRKKKKSIIDLFRIMNVPLGFEGTHLKIKRKKRKLDTEKE